jgi:beta-glucosidase
MPHSAFATRRAVFPEGFVFGAATSAFQIEGSSFGGAGAPRSDTFSATPGDTERGEYGQVACAHYHRWEADLPLLREAGLDGRGLLGRTGPPFARP